MRKDSEELVRSLATETNDMMPGPRGVNQSTKNVCSLQESHHKPSLSTINQDSIALFYRQLYVSLTSPVASPAASPAWPRLALYLGSVLRSTVALHNLINNKMKNKKVKVRGSTLAHHLTLTCCEATLECWALRIRTANHFRRKAQKTRTLHDIAWHLMTLPTQLHCLLGVRTSFH